MRTALRPLARILDARERGADPDQIERENLNARHYLMEKQARENSAQRLGFVALTILVAFFAVGYRMWDTAVSDGAEPRQRYVASTIVQSRADILDRHGRILATNFDTHSLYAQPPRMLDPIVAANLLVQIFPDLEYAKLVKQFTGARKFVWIKKNISPEQKQAVHDIGDPGLQFGPREMRLYPNGSLAAHVLGGASFGKESVAAAEVLGIAGAEKHFDNFLRDPALNGQPLSLSIDLTVQAATEEVLANGMAVMNAKGAAAVLMDVRTGEILAMASLPDFDPNHRPRPAVTGDPSSSPLFNRAVQGVYELGSVFKVFTAAQALDLGLVAPDTMIDTTGPIRWGRHKIGDFRDKGPSLTVAEVISKSSNIGTARIAQLIGTERHKVFLQMLGLFDPTPIELSEARSAAPLIQRNWSELTTMTVSYGHGLSVSPLHVAAGYGAIANGGRLVRPTLIRQSGPQVGVRVLSERAAADARMMLRGVVSDGTASMANVRGYSVAGKTGTADKPKPGGGYYDERVLATFAGLFPAHDPQIAIVVTLDEPEIQAFGETKRTAGWTATPVAGEMIERIAPLLGIVPLIEPSATTGIRPAFN
jgi:cell division protein FtsI (penicillin-binding protein 3)